jgi:SAM-dependent methyltransferase
MRAVSVEGARTFQVAGSAYDRFMGRYSAPLAVRFADAIGVAAGERVLDVGCGPGALTSELVRRVGADAVAAIDPSEPFVQECTRRNPGVDVRLGAAESLPFADGEFDLVCAQLILHFVSDAERAAQEMRRVLRPGGRAASCMWDFSGGMRMLRLFWDSARALDAAAPAQADTGGFGEQGAIARLFGDVGLRDVTGGELEVEVRYESFDDFWSGFLQGTGPSGTYCVSLAAEPQAAVREELYRRVGSPEGPFSLGARAWYAVGTK